jgi:pimeloyl-[acyl-carrier protein] methyl ester esterase
MSRYIFVHGWATDGSVWEDAAWDIARHDSVGGGGGGGGNDGDVTLVNLPGHGNTRRWETPDPLGGQALMALGLEELKKFRALVLVGATASFTQRDGFPDAQPRALVRRMIMDMKADPPTALSRFYGLNFTVDEAKDRAAMDFIERYRYPGPVECSEGGRDTPPGCYPLFNYRDITTALEALYRTDLREDLSAIDLPVLIIHGGRDSVTPVGAGEYLRRNIRGAVKETFDRSGHAPFLTEPERFVRVVRSFTASI